MSPLRTALILILAGSAAPALAARITCESHGDRAEACGTVQPGSSVRMAHQLSSSPCIQGRTWGSDNDSIWVSGGCRAVFDVQPPPYDRSAGNNDDRYDDRANQERANRDGVNSDRADEQRRDDYDRSKYASAGRSHERARRACIDQAVSGRSFGPDDVRTNDVQWIGDGLLSVSLDTPDGPVTCTVDRDGNIRSMDDR